MASEEKIAFLVLDLTKRDKLVGSSPLRNNFRGSDILYAQDEICGMTVGIVNSQLRAIEQWEMEIVCDFSPISQSSAPKQTCTLWEALKKLQEISRNTTLVVPDLKEWLFLQTALIRWQIELYPQQCLDLLSYAQGVMDAKEFSPEESGLDLFIQEIQNSRDLRAKLNLCAELYRRLRELPRRIKQTAENSRWPEPGCCGC